MMKQRMITLLRREYWEHKTGFLITPMVLGAVLLVLLLMAWVLALQASDDLAGGNWVLERQMQAMAQMDDASLENQWRGIFIAVDSIFNLTLFLVLFFYLLGSLADDRKDRSILFWKSMPVSDSETVLSKLLTALAVAPALMLAAEWLTLLAGTALFWFWLLFQDVPAWRLSFGTAPLFSHTLTNAVNYLIHGLWMLPLYGWLLLASAAARRRPFLLATMPLLALIILENFFSLLSDWSIRDNFITPYIINRFKDGIVPVQLHLADSGEAMKTAILRLGSEDSTLAFHLFGRVEMWLGLLLGLAFVAAAIAFRRYREDG